MSSVYWKAPKVSNYTSWIPSLRFNVIYEVLSSQDRHNPVGVGHYSYPVTQGSRGGNPGLEVSTPLGL
ncbi:MAG: hypothetical protein ABI596_05285, partial [Pyrinomonadaceae bacterium]